jgi:5-methylcytosine-specific restriction endonuclease McrA
VDGGLVSKAWAGGSTRRWRTIRAAVLASNQLEHDGRCQLGIPGVCAGRADCVHHKLGRAVTGDDVRYLEAACTPCNLRVGEPDRQSDPRPKAMTRW